MLMKDENKKKGLGRGGGEFPYRRRGGEREKRKTLRKQ